MDRTSRIGLAVCLILLITVEFTLDKFYPQPKSKPAVTAPASPSAVAPAAPAAPAPAAVVSPTVAAAPAAPLIETLTVIENDALKVTFTSVGAAIKEVELKQQKADNGGHVVLNAQSHSNVLALSGWPGADTANFQSQTVPDGAVFSCDLPGGVKWVRTYTFGKSQETESGMSGFLRVLFRKMSRRLGQPETKPLVYTLDVSDALTNTGTTDVTLPTFTLSVGRAEPLRVGGYYPDISNQYLGSGWLASKFHLTTVSNFTPGYVPLIGIKTQEGKDQFSSLTIDLSPLSWIGVENQFFTMLLTPVAERSIQSGNFRCFNSRDAEGNLIVKRDQENYILPGYEPDIEASAAFPAVNVPAGKVVTLNYGLYAGPKDFNRLDALGANQGELMNYGWFELLIVPMLTVLHFWNLIFHNYGVAIILLTLMIKAITWPLQSIANHSGKRMQALAPKLKELQAKHKEHPEKLQTETFALYKEYGVNPFGGCLPALVQMPVFFSLYYMLQNAVELRGQSFLWVHDLTQPDSVVSWALPFVVPFLNTSHLAIHPLPIMVTALTMVMMRMTPQIGDPTQAKIAQIMPVFFLLIFYNFAAALSLYYVINNCVSIFQIYRNLRKPLPELKRVPRKKTG